MVHGHRHVDWVGQTGDLRVISAPSPVMEATGDQPSYFHIHTLAAGANGELLLLRPERIDISGPELLPNGTTTPSDRTHRFDIDPGTTDIQPVPDTAR